MTAQWKIATIMGSENFFEKKKTKIMFANHGWKDD